MIPPSSIADHPYFKWRRDGSVQLILVAAAGCVFLACAGWDAGLPALPRLSSGQTHLAFLVLAGLVGAPIILQSRHAVLALRWISGFGVIAALAGMALLHGPLSVAAFLAACACGIAALVRMRSAHWAEYRLYCSKPEILPGKPPLPG